MSKFKVGDKVKIIGKRNSCAERFFGKVVILTESSEDSELPNFKLLDNNDPEGYDGYCWISDYELVEENPFKLLGGAEEILEGETFKTGHYTTKKTFMKNLITTFKNITRSEPNKTFVKAGVMNEDLTLTDEGKELFIQFMFDKHADLFKKDVVDAILAEQEKK